MSIQNNTTELQAILEAVNALPEVDSGTDDSIFVTPEMFGAVGDGVTDDTSAIQAALDSSKNVVLKRGAVYYCQGLKIPSNTKISGYGAALKVWETAGLITKSENTNGGYGQCKNVTVEGIEFFGTNQPMVTLLACYHTTNFTVRDCVFHDINSWHMIEVNSSKNVTIENCRFYNYGNGTLADSQPSEMVQIDSATQIGYPWGGAYDETICENVTIKNCSFEGLLPDGSFAVSAIGNHSNYINKNIIIENCIIQNFQIGMKWNFLTNTKILNCIIQNCQKGIYCSHKAVNVLIDNNRFTGVFDGNSSNHNAAYRGINIETWSADIPHDNITIQNNVVERFSGHGISVNGDNVVIQNNRVEDCSGFGIYSGYNCIKELIRNNYVMRCGLSVQQNRYSDIIIGYSGNETNDKTQIIDNICGYIDGNGVREGLLVARNICTAIKSSLDTACICNIVDNIYIPTGTTANGT